MKHKLLTKQNLITAAAIVAILVAATIAYFMLRPQPVIPVAISQQINVPIILPETEQVTTVRTDTVKYDTPNKLVTFLSDFDGSVLTVSQQPSPEEFADLPETYQKYVDGLGNYSTFDSPIGKVFLTRPPKIDGAQTAVVNSSGTLMFVRSSKDLSTDQWRRYFTALEIVK